MPTRAALKASTFRPTATISVTSLTIVIPALNEEEAIASIIERCLCHSGWLAGETERFACIS